MKINVLNINNFYTHMTIISTIKGYQWIFDIFKQENKQFHSSIYEYITSVLGIEPNAATDLMIDLDKIAAKDDAARFSGLLKYKNKDLFYTRVRDYFISEKIGRKIRFFRRGKSTSPCSFKEKPHMGH